jgi:hypothetical protein
MGNGEKKTIHYDKILKNLFNISNRLTIYAINALFKKNFNEDAKIEQLNREYIRLDKTTAIADTVLSIEINEQKTKYHIEFQTINDRTLIIRMIDYGFRIAIDDLDYSKIKADEEITVEFPSQIILFLKHNESIPDELNLTIKMPYTEQKIKYIVPTFKIWEHDPDYYKKQKLYIMLPLRIINLSEELENLKKRKLQEEEKTKLLTEYRRKITEVIESIIKELKDALKTDDLIIEECNKILMEFSTLAGELFSEEVKDIEQEVNEMAKMIIDPEVYRRGFEEGIEKGKTIINQELYQKGLEKGMEKGMVKTMLQDLSLMQNFTLPKTLKPLRISFKEAVLKRGIPKILYTDNGKIYRSGQ